MAYASVGECPTENSAKCRYVGGPCPRTMSSSFAGLREVNNGQHRFCASRRSTKLPTLVSSEGPSTSRNRGVFFLVCRGELRSIAGHPNGLLRAGRTPRPAILLRANVADGMRDYRGGTAAAVEVILREPHHRHDGDRSSIYSRSMTLRLALVRLVFLGRRFVGARWTRRCSR
jgi:hypothetical protein